MSYIEILILRHLTKRPAHGYELRKRVEAVTGVTLHNNSLYPALRRFEEAGAVAKTIEPQEGRPPRLVYELTDVGNALLHDMLADLPPDQAADDTEFMSRLGQFGFLSPDERLAVLDARDAALAERLERMPRLHDRSGGEFWSGMVTSELIARARREREWLAELRPIAAESAGPAATRQNAPSAQNEGYAHAAPGTTLSRPRAGSASVPDTGPTGPAATAQPDRDMRTLDDHPSGR
jgi:DNA-binding PadR family transcriptional regulator